MRTPMAPEQTRPQPYKTSMLWAMLILAAIYATWLLSQGTITGYNVWDGALGLLLGLFICSRPVGNAMDLLFSELGSRWPDLMRRKGVTWMAMNLLVLLVGWFIVFLGATRLPRPQL